MKTWQKVAIGAVVVLLLVKAPVTTSNFVSQFFHSIGTVIGNLGLH